MTRVAVIPADRGGCGYYRLAWPAQAVAHARPDWEILIIPPEKVEAGFRDGRFIGVRGFPDNVDLLVMQRVGTPGQIETLKWASQQGIATVVDFDDAMWCIDKENMAWRMWNLANPHNQHWRICDDAARVADLITVTTDPLAKRYAQHGRVEVIPNRVPAAALSIEPHERERNETLTAGWAGFTRTHPGDCKVSEPAARAVREAGGRLCVIADALGAAMEWQIPLVDIKTVPAQRLGMPYFKALTHLDLMLVGLQDTPFNRAKSTLKVLEAGAAGAFSIAPDNGPHRALQKSGFPMTLVDSPAEWRVAATKFTLMKRPVIDALRAEVAQAVEENHTIEGNAEDWAQAWERAMRRKALLS